MEKFLQNLVCLRGANRHPRKGTAFTRTDAQRNLLTKKTRRLLSVYSDMFAPAQKAYEQHCSSSQTAQQKKLGFLHAIEFFSDRLREAWAATDETTTEFLCMNLHFWLLSLYTPARYYVESQDGTPSMEELMLHYPRSTFSDPIQYALKYLREKRHLLRKCANPNCKVEPFFFAVKGISKFCCHECANYGRKQSKLRDYHKNKDKRRANQKQSNSEAETA
jgi:hypothetical protein